MNYYYLIEFKCQDFHVLKRNVHRPIKFVTRLLRKISKAYFNTVFYSEDRNLQYEYCKII